MDIRRQVGPWGEGLSPAVQAVYDRVRADIPFMEEDREIRLDIEKIEKLVRSEALLAAVKELVPEFE